MLLVDDHAMVVESFRRVLDAATDIDVVSVAGCAADAMAAAAAHSPDVVLIDYVLPDGDGATTAMRIKAQLPDARIILLTGSDDPRALRAAVAAGCVGYLEKTSALDRLPAAIRAAASGEAIISPRQLERLHLQTGAAAPRAIGLTPRENEILRLVAEGLANQAIAERLFLSVNTVRTHVQTILDKLGAHSKLEAVTIARRQGVLGPNRG